MRLKQEFIHNMNAVAAEKDRDAQNVLNRLQDLGSAADEKEVSKLVDNIIAMIKRSDDTRIRSFAPHIRVLQKLEPGSGEYFDAITKIGRSLKMTTNRNTN